MRGYRAVVSNQIKNNYTTGTSTTGPGTTDDGDGISVQNESRRTIGMATSSLCKSIPSTAKGYTVHATVRPEGSPMAFLTLYPTGQTRPNVSMLNAFQGQMMTNSTIVPAGAQSDIDLFVCRATKVVLEVTGYFAR